MAGLRRMPGATNFPKGNFCCYMAMFCVYKYCNYSAPVIWNRCPPPQARRGHSLNVSESQESSQTPGQKYWLKSLPHSAVQTKSCVCVCVWVCVGVCGCDNDWCVMLMCQYISTWLIHNKRWQLSTWNILWSCLCWAMIIFLEGKILLGRNVQPK